MTNLKRLQREIVAQAYVIELVNEELGDILKRLQAIDVPERVDIVSDLLPILANLRLVVSS